MSAEQMSVIVMKGFLFMIYYKEQTLKPTESRCRGQLLVLPWFYGSTFAPCASEDENNPNIFFVLFALTQKRDFPSSGL